MTVSVFSSWKYSISNQFQKYLQRKDSAKTFGYAASNVGETFVLDTTPNPSLSYMTSLQAGVQLGDYIQIYHPDKMTTYQIQEIEYYREPSDMWMAKLLKVDVD